MKQKYKKLQPKEMKKVDYEIRTNLQLYSFVPFRIRILQSIAHIQQTFWIISLVKCYRGGLTHASEKCSRVEFLAKQITFGVTSIMELEHCKYIEPTIW